MVDEPDVPSTTVFYGEDKRLPCLRCGAPASIYGAICDECEPAVDSTRTLNLSTLAMADWDKL